ncbi:alkaline phosphatase family protein [uncultured Tessaracoccus sp.]|uniref:alkaline phosphatase family protein n=1 Tax=uncultured Tessaracoccus sp. TaxID=905023 RepID=UPI0025EF4633|nr:alkaline phosphatase family protein [uncultured Tessaracoccus sp.]
MTSAFVRPDHHGDALCNLLPSVAARLDDTDPVIDVPRASKYVVLLVDGLGWDVLHAHADYADRLLTLDARPLTCSVPSTTACSLTTLGTGRTPGRHGIVGYTFREPRSGEILNALTWEHGPDDVGAFRQEPTVFQRLAARDVRSAAVTLARFDGTALTQCAFDGTALCPRPEDEGDVEGTVAAVAEALVDHDVVYCYQRLLDHAGHTSGVGSWQWLAQLEAADELAAGIAALADADTCVLVTGDHGMVNVPPEHRLVAEDPALAGFDAIGGEGRFRQLYTDDPRTLAWRWRTVLGERAEVWLRDEAIEAGWYGDVVTDRTRARIGDVLVAMREDWAVMSLTFQGEYTLVGMHGSLTHAEMVVPLLQAGGTR